MADSYGYEDVDAVVDETKKQSSKYLRFDSDQKQTFQVRIASEPRYVIRHWVDKQPLEHTGENCQYCGKQVKDADKIDKTAQWAWIVIDRADEMVKVYQGPNSVALSIRDLSQLTSKKTGNVIYGDPRTWDVIITRYKKPNGFFAYEVSADPESRGEMTAEEKKAVAEAHYDLEKELKGGKKSENVGNYTAKADFETAPDVNPDDIPDDLGVEETAGKKATLANGQQSNLPAEDDIPF